MVIFLLVGSAFPWFAVVEAGSVFEALATDSRPFLLLIALVASPFCILIVLWALWRMFRWKRIAIFVDGGHLWLANRMRPLPLESGATFELSESDPFLPGLRAIPYVSMVGHLRTWKYPLPKTTEAPSEILDRLRDHMIRLDASLRSGGR
ncbi:hypothetical protein [Brevundimonas basaltis]|uniref:Uncharacterized protein n=1 Tax=Brevundimonas basaltis TaxID=472166 RepID=A0A7W8MFR5_9CAUL|nr:hypothetical protein [Brevundimonas basaltis]MBB5290879.1 hypothetical protein [Brevundimonas basaltis]